ncbi:MAG: ABC transporter ATP-binding protein [Eggerthellaceae bacterium]|nr:ABC transporter ATP-binding protein [Eggerthellaceae bacterium]
MPRITFKDLEYSYVDSNETYLALENINLTINDGEFLCLVGHSGCGKSTMLSLIAGLIKPTKGSVCIDDAPIEGPGPDRSIVFQNYSLFSWQKALKNVSFSILKTHPGVTKEQADERALDLLDRVGMKEAANRYPFQLSGGMRQRVAIARALAVEADTMLLDEPFGALDPAIRKKLQHLLLDLWNDQEKSCCKNAVFVTHDIDEALILADRIVFMEPRHIIRDFTLPKRDPGEPPEARVLLPEMIEMKAEILDLFEKTDTGSED